jgi:anaerobic selenocysteine-containing dehydrogenase
MPRHVATCTICEAGCGILVETEGDRVTSVRGDPDDPASRGYVCPKVVGMQDLHEDPDRLRTPLVRDGDRFREATWEEALDRAAEGIARVRARHGRDAVAVYQGNPTVHNLGLMVHGQAVLRTLGTRNLYSATTVDQAPQMRAAHEIFGDVFLMPVPDLDRVDHLLVLGANPLVSNGSIMTAPDVRRRLLAIRERGGRIVVVDPRRTETAAIADEHVFVRPGTDPAFLLSILATIFEERLEAPGDLRDLLIGLDDLRRATRGFSPEQTAPFTGVPAETTRRVARDFARADRAACYGRVGICHQVHGTLAAWLIYALGAVTGHLDRPGTTMWTTPAAELVTIAGLLGARGLGRRRSRVRGLPSLAGELPIATLADEIETPGPGQVRALITSAGNPVLSAPNGRRLERALGELDHLVCIDLFLNETTRHAHVILPPVSPLQRPHYDLALAAFSVRNVAKWSDPVIPRGAEERHDWEILAELAIRLRLPFGRRLASGIARRLGPELFVDLALRAGPYRTSVGKLRRDAPHGADFGPLEPRLPTILRTPDGKIHVAPQAFLDELPQLRADLARTLAEGELLLIGRRHLRSNNSWLHNSARLVKGRTRCTLRIHPTDASRLGLAEGARAEIESARGKIEIPIEITDEIMPGVVSVPHGFGHSRPGTRLSVAGAHAGVSVNDVTDETFLDRLTGNAAFSGVPVRVRAVKVAASAAE